jgi:hypothetical protein
MRLRAEFADMHLIGKLTLAKLNFPEKMVLPTCLIISLNAVLYLETRAGSVNGNPPSFAASGAL